MSTLKMKWKKVQPCSYALTLKQDAWMVPPLDDQYSLTRNHILLS